MSDVWLRCPTFGFVLTSSITFIKNFFCVFVDLDRVLRHKMPKEAKLANFQPS